MGNKYVLFIGFILSLGFYAQAQDKWEAPESANTLKSPFAVNSEVIASGHKIYASLCTACHGVSGKGDGVAAAGLNPKPADFTSETFQAQSEGAVFWKISKGRGLMASYENMLPESDRWKLVAYLKSLGAGKTESMQKQKPEEETTNKVENTFLFTLLINTQTVQTLKKGTSDFTIQHRFGVTELNEAFIRDFLGMDLSANLRLAYAQSITDKLYMELGRTKYGKTYDLGVKYRIKSQTKDDKMPFTMTFYGDIGVRTDKFPDIVTGSTFANNTPFAYRFAHRLSYNSQLIVGRKFSDKFSLQVAPVFIWHNLVTPDAENMDFAIPVGGRYALNYKSAVLFEITPKIIAKDKRVAWSLAYEIASSGAHAFQLIVSSTDRILEQAIYSGNTVDYTAGQFVLGFNIKRVF